MDRADRDDAIGAVRAGCHARFVLDVPSRPEEVSPARHAVARFLLERGVAKLVVDDVELIVSELVTNAVIHPLGPTEPVHVAVELADDVVVTVSNVGSCAAIPPPHQWRPAPPLAMSGRGLGIVRRLSDAVGVEQDGDRAVVWSQRHLPDGGAST